MTKNYLVKKYLETVNKNLNEIGEILKNNDINDSEISKVFTKILTNSSQNISKKWTDGKKYIRTEFVVSALGDDYPMDMLEESLSVDAMINILDDLLDENLGKKEKILYVIEYLRIFSNYAKQKPTDYRLDKMGSYFNKLITLAIAENEIMKEIKDRNDINEVVDLSIKLLMLRGMDIDLFVEIVNTDNDDNMSIAARIFRAQNIFKKDLYDIKRDLENNQETVVTYVVSNEKIKTSDYINAIVTEFDKKFGEIKSNQRFSKGFHELANKDTMEIRSWLKSQPDKPWNYNLPHYKAQ